MAQVRQMLNKSLAIVLIGLLVPLLAACTGNTPASDTAPAAATAPPATFAAPAESATEVPTATAQSAPEAPVTSEAADSTQDVIHDIVRIPTGDERQVPEIRDIASWINSEPLTFGEQRGKVVLVDFWTYTCINCIRTFPFLKVWHEKYKDHGLVIVGVHAPEFDFEKERDNVVRATEEFGITWPVAQDNEMGTWRAFNNRFWPAKYLVDAEGRIRYTHFGEGSYEETELWIRSLLIEAGADLSRVSADTAPEPTHSSAAGAASPGLGLTRELYAGYERNLGTLLSRSAPPYVAQREYFENRDSEYNYQDPGDYENHFLYIQGLWRNEAERLVHARSTDGYEDYLATKFFATSVNAVMAPGEGEPLKVRVLLDDEPISPENAGVDVMFDGPDGPYIFVDGWRLYNIVTLAEFEGHVLKLSSNSPDFSLFAYTFGAYEGGEPAKVGPNG
ncbi:MAG: redoxin family protein [Chloroflexi bacterium]|nr:redoxin family protein [Chloroflexota bacterium]MCI0791299.1 redoxin family protein [Chloroflexota bacterium]MCI0795718.1 redoxin family protein [Chloroflexota bacterium]MCI0812845.1 redoxin family protein [Chloroflexota bacterium]MCI0822435.1 redoxin family protein [Chloroflexota bacterium]